jgi:hypothetical protein
MDIGKAVLVSAVLVSGAVLIGINQVGLAQGQNKNQAVPRYQIVTGSNAVAWRLDTISGEVSLCSINRMDDSGKCSRAMPVFRPSDFDDLGK